MSAIRFRKRSPDEEFDVRVRSDPLVRLLVETAFDHENRIRVLEGKQPVTRQQSLTALRNRYKGAA